jgi:RimJ/RimL family protein N-acetyltransferase
MDIMNKNMTIMIATEVGSLTLRAARENDLGNLRQWKNEQREFFFHKDIITPELQREWFTKFQTRNHDYMFIVELNDKSMGCMGIRLLDDAWDIYNVILGLPEYGKKGYMGKALQAMLTHAQAVSNYPITLQVLKVNPAVAWYKKNGFVATDEHADYYSLANQSNNI